MEVKSYHRRMSDVDLCTALVPAAGPEYRRALDVLTAYPDYAQSKFRIVAEHLVDVLGQHANVKLKKSELFHSINSLHEAQVIDDKLSEQLHAIRTAGNDAVHATKTPLQAAVDAANSSQQRGAGNVEHAHVARETLIGVFKSVFLLVNKGNALPEVTAVEVGDLISQQTLWKAVSTLDFEAKMAAGLILEAQSMAPIPKGVLIIAESHDAHKVTTQRMAAELYWAACVISSGADSTSHLTMYRDGGGEAFMYKNANTEALFRYSVLTVEGPTGEESHKRGVKALEAAASRFFVPACTLHGNLLRIAGKYEEAFKFLSYALEHGDSTVHAALGFLYLEKDYANYSQIQAEQCLINGIDSGVAHCGYILGRLLYDGEELKKDKVRGKALLESAAKAGNQLADMYCKLVVDDRLIIEFQNYQRQVERILNQGSQIKQGRNDLCACQSGLKYKKCCGRH